METETLINEKPPETKARCTCTSCLKADGVTTLDDVRKAGDDLKAYAARQETQGLHEVEIDPNTLTLEEVGDGNRIKFTGPIEESLIRQSMQGPHEVEINTESDGDDRVSVTVSILIPPSSDHPLYDRYAYEFEKSMWQLVVKCLELSEKFKRDDLSISAFTIEATLFLRGENANDDDGENYGFPHNYPDPSAGNSGLFTDDSDTGFGSRRPHWLNEALKPLEAEKKGDEDEPTRMPFVEL
jgi:hypothetical protein